MEPSMPGMARPTRQMKNSLIILAIFTLGIILGRFAEMPEWLVKSDTALFALWFFMGLIGISIGADSKLGAILKTVRPRVLLLPFCTTIGTFAGAAAASFLVEPSLSACLAIGAGFGYYSLSSIFITQYLGADMGTIALGANIIREVLTLILAPAIVFLFGPGSLISCGGCTTMDTTLPVITQYAGRQWVFTAIIHAVVLDFSVPLWVTFFCSF